MITVQFFKRNPLVVNFQIDTPVVVAGGGGVTSVLAGVNIAVDSSNPAAPVVHSLADRYKTTSTSGNTVGNGVKTFTVDANLSFIPLQEVLIVADAANHMHGTVVSYGGNTLVVDVKYHTGAGTYTAWVINLDGVPVDGITGAGLANRLTYFTGPQVVGALPAITPERALKADANGLPTPFDTNTEPSMAELAHVKGVTGPIQTQFSDKENTISAGTTSQYFRGDKTFQNLDKDAVGLSDVDNTSDANKPISNATQLALDDKQDTLSLTTNGTSGPATLVGSTLNIPQYSGGGGGGGGITQAEAIAIALIFG